MVWALLLLLAAGADDPEKFTIEGNVVNAVTGEPLRRAAIAMQGAQATQFGIQSQQNNSSIAADAGGHFVIAGLSAGSYSLSAEKQGFSHAPPVSVQIGPQPFRYHHQARSTRPRRWQGNRRCGRSHSQRQYSTFSFRDPGRPQSRATRRHRHHQ